MTEEQIKNKELCERFPFLVVRNRWTGKIPDDYDYSYIEGIGAIPTGWERLFLQYCEDIRQPLIDINCLDKFRFSQIKEKYGSLRLYNFGATKEINDITDNYEYVSQFVCQNCGKPATVETQGWIASYCNECFKKMKHYTDENVEPIEFEPIRRVTVYKDGKKHSEEIDVSDIWNRLYNEDDANIC